MQSLHSSRTAAAADDKFESAVVAGTPSKSAKKNAVKSSAVATAAVAAALARPSECASIVFYCRPCTVPMIRQSSLTGQFIGTHTCWCCRFFMVHLFVAAIASGVLDPASPHLARMQKAIDFVPKEQNTSVR
jgi:hypothetical protein